MPDNGIEEISPTIEMEVEVEPSAEIEMEMEVDMGGTASEYNAEAWAVGERHGVPVSETDQTYHNNAKYYAGKTAEDRTAIIQAEQTVVAKAAEAETAAGKAQGHEEAAEQAREEAEAAAREAAETVVAAQGPGLCYVDSEGIPYVLE